MEAIINQKNRDFSQRKAPNKPILSGIFSGQISGLIMAVVVMIVFTLFLGKGPLFPVQVIGSMAFGEAALPEFHFGAFLAGLFLHQMGPSLLWGAVYGTLANKLSIRTTGQALKLGIGVGILSMVGPYVLIPFLMKALHGVDIWNREVPLFWDWAAHFVFGVSFSLYPTIANKLDS